jgi:hypothetical protein
MVIGNINDDPALEIITMSSDGNARQLLALKADGSLVPGWPQGTEIVPHLALGQLSTSSPGLEVVSKLSRTTVDMGTSIRLGGLSVHDGSGNLLPGFPITYTLGGGSPSDGIPVMFDVDGDGRDEIFAGGLTYKADGTLLQDWSGKAQYPVVGDLDRDGRPEIVTNVGGSKFLRAYHQDGTEVAGFAPEEPTDWTTFSNHLVIGDVDGDGAVEVVMLATRRFVPGADNADFALSIMTVSANGDVKLSRPLRVVGLTDPIIPIVLGDLDCDGAAEIILQSEDKLHVWKADGTDFPGWPQDGGWRSDYPPVVGDIDGDGWPDIVALGVPAGELVPTMLYGYNRNGQLLPGFPKSLPLSRGPVSGGAIPAIADVDADGRNEVIVMSGMRADYQGPARELWMFDLHGTGKYGPVQWGQYMGGPQHQSYYKSDPGSCKR